MQTDPSHVPREENAIRTIARPDCYVCGRPGNVLYADLSDRLFATPGQWTLKRCRKWNCGMLWLDPAPHPKDLGIAYETYYTHSAAVAEPLLDAPHTSIRNGYLAARYGYPDPSGDRGQAYRIWRRPVWQAALDFDVFYLRHMPAGRLLEIGCGNGSKLNQMQKLGWIVEGVDFDPGAVAAAGEIGLSVRLGTVEDQTYPDASFDAVAMSHVIEHLPDPLATLAECRRILKPGGTLVSVTPNARSLGHRLFTVNWRGLEPPRHLQIFTPRALRQLAATAGFQRIRTRTTIRDACNMIIASQKLRAQPGPGSAQAIETIDRRPAKWLQLLEHQLIWLGLDVGEEMVLTGTA